MMRVVVVIVIQTPPLSCLHCGKRCEEHVCEGEGFRTRANYMRFRINKTKKFAKME